MTIKKNDYSTFGKLLIKIQFLETLIKISISLFKQEIKDKDPRIKNLSYSKILEDSKSGSKQTLGQLIFVIKKEIESFDNDEFEELLSKRNTFIHNFHKEYLSINASQETNLSKFTLRLWELTDKYTDIFTGLISLSMRNIGKGKLDLKGIEKNEVDLINYLQEKSK